MKVGFIFFPALLCCYIAFVFPVAVVLFVAVLFVAVLLVAVLLVIKAPLRMLTLPKVIRWLNSIMTTCEVHYRGMRGWLLKAFDT